ncbi:uncharacterized protein PV07_08421 [Cladophialophora immunda]|uniref:Uncharacterized protein n=1 Tax=Cladophialophora immunda TaxID=569365 RepID=A0A0D2C3Z3_9EURO|nr:uncharacterized protein PV07_08421 [Cladophialophora immunda]KIW25225.1 hypothetical protein PV07_08421 [Cladophialophora immunda]
MVDDILRQQEVLLEKMVQEIDYVLPPEESGKLAKAKMQVKDYRERVQKVDRDAERVDKTIQDQLNLKRTYASS